MLGIQDYLDVKSGANTAEERAQADRSSYLEGRRMYPTPPPQSLSERDRGCYMMGYNVTEFEDKHDVN